MSSFEEAFDEVIGLEGGYVNDPKDPGGETKWGISRRSYPKVDIKNLTKEGAKQIYWSEFWNPLQLGLVLDNDIATEIFEQSVNMGKRQAVLHVQRALNLMSEKVVADGYMGPVTIKALNGLRSTRRTPFLKALNGFQFMRYVELVDSNLDLKTFFVGWLRRVVFYE